MTATVTVDLHGGTRQPLQVDRKVLLAVRGQFELPNESRVVWLDSNRTALTLDVPDDGRGYALLAALKGHEDVGVVPLKLQEGEQVDLSLMLVSRDAEYRFEDAHWDRLPWHSPERRIVTGFEAKKLQDVGDRYMRWQRIEPAAAACFLNVVAALRLMPLGGVVPGLESAVDFLVALDWDNLRRDRFFAYARRELSSALENAVDVEEESLPGIFHPGAKASFKQTAFREANVQITFHGQTIGSDPFGQLVRVELDMDYYHDLLSHTLLEVMPNTLSFGQRKTDPRRIYVMRWMAGRANPSTGNFEPLYTLG